jgi:hypothetical protein
MKFNTLLALSMLAVVYCSAQQKTAQPTNAAPAPTTAEEYNFVTKGFRIQTEGGLDAKKGYHFNELFEKQFGNYNFTAKTLVREQKTEIAAILIIINSKISQKDYYVCIPYDNPELLQRYWTELSNWEKPLLLAYTQIVTIYLGAYAVINRDLEKKTK